MNTVGILGAGAVGASVAAMMLDATTEERPDVVLVADGNRGDRFRADGIVVNGTRYRPRVVADEPVDLLIVATKSPQLESAVPLLRRVTGPDTLVMSLLNGITSELVLQESVPAERVVPAMIVGIDALRNGSGVQYLNTGTIHFGADDERYPVPAEAIRSIAEVFGRLEISYTVSDEIVRTLWWKFMVNVGTNQVSAVTGGSYGLFQRTPEVMSLMRAAMEEVITLSQLEGTGLEQADIDEWISTLMTLDPQGKTSMLQDIEAGRPTELDLFAGAVLDLAEKHGIKTPVNKILYLLIRALESKADTVSQQR